MVSTLLNILGLLDKASKGKVEIFDQQSIRPFSRKAEKLLHDKIGYLFQNYALIENETIEYNLNIVFDYRIKKEERKQKIAEALDQVGLKGMEKKKVYQCSGGEQQRIALARLLIKPCQLILADEPTGNLDYENKEKVFNLLKAFNQNGKTVITIEAENNKDIEDIEQDFGEKDFIIDLAHFAFHFGEEVEKVLAGGEVPDFDITKPFTRKRLQ